MTLLAHGRSGKIAERGAKSLSVGLDKSGHLKLEMRSGPISRVVGASLTGQRAIYRSPWVPISHFRYVINLSEIVVRSLERYNPTLILLRTQNPKAVSVYIF